MRCRVMDWWCLFGRQGAQREGVNLLAHAFAQRIINQLMLLDEGKPDKGRRNDQGLEMGAVVSQDLYKSVGKPLLDE